MNKDENIAENSEKPRRPKYVGRFQLLCKKGIGEFNALSSILLIFPINFIYQCDLSMYNTTVYTISTYFNVGTTTAQLFAISQNISNAAFGIFGSVIANKITTRDVLIIFLLIVAGTNFLLPWGSFYYCLAIKLLSNFCFSIIGPTANPSLKLMVKPESYRLAMSRFSSIQCIAGIMAPLLAGMFCDLPFSWKAIPLFLGSLCFVTAILFLFCFPKVSYVSQTQGNREDEVKEKHSFRKNPSFDLIGSILLILFVVPLSIVLVLFSVIPWYIIVVFIVVSIGSLVGYILFEKQLVSGRLISFEIFKNKKLVLCLVLYFFCIVTFRIPMILTPLIIQQVYRLSSLISGFVNAFTFPVGLLVMGLLMPRLMKHIKMHIILTVCLFFVGVFGILTSVLCLLDTPIPLIVCQLLFSCFVNGSIIIISMNCMNFTPRHLLAVTGCIQEVTGQLGAVFGQLIAVTIRDMLIPVFDDETDPLSRLGIRIGSLICGSIISSFCIICSIFAPRTKNDEGYVKASVIESAEIPIEQNTIVDEVNEGPGKDKSDDDDSNKVITSTESLTDF